MKRTYSNRPLWWMVLLGTLLFSMALRQQVVSAQSGVGPSAANALSTPVLLTPSSGAKLATLTPAFTWKASLPAPDHYRIQISQTKTFSVLDIDETTASTETQWNFPPDSGLMPDRVYIWRVSAVSAAGETSAWTTGRVFTTLPLAPTPIVPAEGQTPNSLRPVFEWEPVSNSGGYQIQISSIRGASMLPFVSATIKTGNAYSLAASLKPNAPYAWKVRALGKGGPGPWSTPIHFTAPNPPSVPTPLHPSSEVVKDYTAADFYWRASSGDPTQYEIQTSDTATYSPLSKNTKSTLVDASTELADPAHPHVTISLDPGVYYWRIRAANSRMEWSAWSSSRKFYTYSQITLQVIDPVKREPIPYVAIQTNDVDNGASNINGIGLIANARPGTLKVTLSADGFAARTIYVTVPLAKSIDLGKIGLAPTPADGQVRVVLYTNPQPPARDLALHLWLPVATPAHLSPTNPGKLGGFPEALIEQPDATIQWVTIADPQAGSYRLAVQQKSATPASSLAKARISVAVYAGASQIASYTPPAYGSGSWWYVFDLDGASRTLTTRNQLRSSLPTPYLDAAISGKIVQENGHPLAGVMIDYGSGQVTTNVSGEYLIAGIAPGSYTLTPAKKDYRFEPTSVPVSAPAEAVNFTGFHADSNPGQPSAVAAQGDYVYMGIGSRLDVVNVADKTAPALSTKTWVSAQGQIRRIRLSGNYAYLAQGSDGLNILSLADPANPTWQSNVPMGNCTEVVLQGRYAYAFDLATGTLWVIDVSNPGSPKVSAKLNSPLTGALDGAALAIHGNYLYAGISDLIPGGQVAGRLAIYSLARPQKPALVKSIPQNVWFYDLVAQNQTLFASGEAWENDYYVEAGLISVFDLSSPTAPKELYGNLDGGDLQPRLTLSGAYALAGTGNQGMKVYDFSNPLEPVEHGSITSAYPPTVDLAGQDGAYAYLIDTRQLTIIDLQDPDQPTALGVYTPAPAE